MHLPLEKKFIWYIEGVVVAFMLLFFFAVAPDVMHHEGRKLGERAAAAAVERGMKEGPEMEAATTGVPQRGFGRSARGRARCGNPMERVPRGRVAQAAQAPGTMQENNADRHEGEKRDEGAAHEGTDRMIDTIAERLTPERRESREVVPSAVLAVLVLVACESMFFAGLVSAFTIVKSTAVVWPPVGQPRLPFEETAINTAALLASARVAARGGEAVQGRPVGGRAAFPGHDAARDRLRRAPGPRVGGAPRAGPDAHVEHARELLLLDRRCAHGLHAIAGDRAPDVRWWRLRRGQLSDAAFLAIQFSGTSW
jgi:hypothetical protein